MQKFPALAVAVGLLTASCAGHGGSSGMPPMAQSRAGSPLKTASAASAPAGWSTTSTLALPVANATDLGAASASQSITVLVGLKLHNMAQLQQAVASGTVLSDATVNSAYGPTSSDVSAVTTYLQSKGLTNISVEPNNLLISATGTIAQVQSAFDTSIHSFSGGGTNFNANVTPAYVPTSLGGIVASVLGLNNLQAFKPTPSVTSCEVEGQSTPPQACLRFYDPATFQVAYDAGSTSAASATSVAIMAEGNVSQSISDLRLNESQFGLPQVPVHQIQVGVASTDTSGDTEWTLDMTYSSGIAQNLKAIDLYVTTSLTDSDIALEYNRWVTQHYTNIANSSFGGCEVFPYLDGSMVMDDEILLEGASKGMTMFASSGDNGGYCNNLVDTNGAPGGAPFVEYPAASPYVVAVGGTDLFTNADGTYKGETAWEAGGGGLSQFEYSPYWETQAQPVSKNGESMRGVPDVAMDASLETGAELWGGSAVNGSCTPCVTGGTSLASPLSAGVWARVQTAHGNRLGFAPVWYYKDFVGNAAGAMNAGPPPWQPDGGFHDVVSGSNGLYTAAPGYDYTTGLGSVDISVLNSQL
ncbi:MAG TPA: S53 family peptidase [Candidatus Baltobacteraceae bacterium]|nr:S53 family peptidase [Candidatus Baltobacteraceae bacterium]